METAGVIGILIAIIICRVGWISYLRASVKPRSTTTTLDRDAIRAVFEDKVARLGWTIVDWDSPMIAQSPLLAGRRQQLALVIGDEGGRNLVTIAPVRVWTKGLLQVPYKAHTLRMRMDGFISAVNTAAASSPAPSEVSHGALAGSVPLAPVEGSAGAGAPPAPRPIVPNAAPLEATPPPNPLSAPAWFSAASDPQPTPSPSPHQHTPPSVGRLDGATPWWQS